MFWLHSSHLCLEVLNRQHTRRINDRHERAVAVQCQQLRLWSHRVPKFREGSGWGGGIGLRGVYRIALARVIRTICPATHCRPHMHAVITEPLLHHGECRIATANAELSDYKRSDTWVCSATLRKRERTRRPWGKQWCTNLRPRKGQRLRSSPLPPPPTVYLV